VPGGTTEDLLEQLLEAEEQLYRASAALYQAEYASAVQGRGDDVAILRVAEAYCHALQEATIALRAWQQLTEQLAMRLSTEAAKQLSSDYARIQQTTTRTPDAALELEVTPKLRFAKWLHDHGRIEG
jgi:tagatose-1,6-bisphosphate aldolase non-catalytic subunit AgaZ/GatZ